MFGFLLGIIRFGLEFGFSKPSCGSGLVDERPEFVKHFVDDIHYLHYGALLFVITGITTIVISLMTEPIPPEKLYRLTFWSRKSDQVREGFDDEEDTIDKEMNDKPKSEEAGQVKGFRKLVYLICGISQKSETSQEKAPKKTLEEEAAEAAEFLKEKTSLKIINNLLCILSLSLAVFVVAFYA